jgi:predicted TIM-barrel fold metal-dependent hydrolase
MLFDTHLHLIYPNKIAYPWLTEVPKLNKPYKYEEYEITANRLGIEACLHMEVDVYEGDIKNETMMVDSLSKQPGSKIKGIISACRPEQQGFGDFVNRAAQNNLIKGFRRVLHVVSDDVSQNPFFRENINLLVEHDFTFDICARADQLPIVVKLIDACPNVKFILDHCGVPDVKNSVFSSWAAAMTNIAQRPNVTAKISGIIAYGDGESWSLSDMKPFFEHTVDVFGIKRIIWGSDSPVCQLGGGLPTWVALTHTLTGEWSKSERKSFYRENAYKLWNMKDN